MAEYYPLLAKAVSSLPNSTPDSRKLVYERARKALIGQLRTLHPPVPDDDIARESDALDRAVARLESELGASLGVAPADTVPPPIAPAMPPPKSVEDAPRFPASGGALGPASTSKPSAPLRTKIPATKAPTAKAQTGKAATTKTLPKTGPKVDTPAVAALASDARVPTAEAPAPPVASAAEPAFETKPPETKPAGILLPKASSVSPPRDPGLDEGQAKVRPEPQRPIAPQPKQAKGPKRPLWIIPLGIAVVVLLVGIAAYKLRDKPNLLTRAKPAEQTTDAGSKIVERVGVPGSPSDSAPQKSGEEQAAPGSEASQQQSQAPANPAAAVSGRAALLVEASDEPENKVKTYLGTVVWRLDNVSDDQNQAVGLAVRADIDLPDDKLKATVLFQKNSDGSLPASHTMKVRFIVQPGSVTGNVKQINVPQMRREDSGTGDALDGVSVPIVENSFLIGLTPGKSEASNLDLLRSRDWIDIPMLLTSSKIAKLTFEKTAAGQRDLQEAITAWSKQ